MTRIALHAPAFAADPHTHYRYLREWGPVAPVEIVPGVDAWLVTDYALALRILCDTETWSRDARPWQGALPPDSPVLPMLGWQPTALFADGPAHARLRQVITDSLGIIEPHLLQRQVAAVAERLIGEFGPSGHAELISRYARRLPALVLNSWYGIPDAVSDRITSTLASVVESGEDATAAYADFTATVSALVAERRAAPRGDLISAFLAHPADLDDEEAARHITLTLSAGHEPTANLIGNALLRMLTDDRYAGSLYSGAMTARQAITATLWHEPPLATFSAHYPRADVELQGVRIRRDQLVLISYAAANTQAAPDSPADADKGGENAHLAWAAGPHRCPAQAPATLIAVTAIEHLISRLADLTLAIPAAELSWRPGPFHRALRALPVRFTAVRPPA
ncbi:cytochrome P450 [Streptomyces sp. NPDC051940]|uniref:cytochrome P450 n=1 Tax=Streptomyces sp. NPDC051940 TaxID=3155675 RepID=UPI00343472CB